MLYFQQKWTKSDTSERWNKARDTIGTRCSDSLMAALLIAALFRTHALPDGVKHYFITRCEFLFVFTLMTFIYRLGFTYIKVLIFRFFIHIYTPKRYKLLYQHVRTYGYVRTDVSFLGISILLYIKELKYNTSRYFSILCSVSPLPLLRSNMRKCTPHSYKSLFVNTIPFSL